MKIRLYVLVICCGILLSACAGKETGEEVKTEKENKDNGLVLCSINGCKNGVYKDGLCAEHYVSILGQSESPTITEEPEALKEEAKSENDNALSLIEVPDVSGVEEELAKQLILKKSLIPVIESDYSYDVKKGNVIRTEPKSGTQVDEDTKVSIFVSKGPSFYLSSGGTITWKSISGYKADDWSFSNPYIDYEKLYIYCEYVPSVDIQFKNTGFGNASLSDSFDKEAPLSLQKPDHSGFGEGRRVSAGTKVSFYIVISLNQLESDFPTHVACSIVIYVGNKEQTINVSFNMEWDTDSMIRKEDMILPGAGEIYDNEDYYYDDDYYGYPDVIDGDWLTFELLDEVKDEAVDAEYYFYIIQDSDWRLLTESDLRGLSAKELTYARNEIYARHGYIFKAQELNDYFYLMSWYYPDSSYSGDLSSVEQKNANLIKDYQKANGLEYSPK